MENLGRKLTTRVTLPIGALGVAIAKTGVAYNTLEQTSRAAFTTLLGGAAEANQMMEKLHEFGSTSPFPRQVWIKGTQQLIGFGLEAERVIPTLNSIQDATAAIGGGSEDIATMIDIFAQIQGQGKITGRELNRLGLVGIDAAGMIAESMSSTANDIRDDISAGAIDAETALTTLTSAMDARFAGAAANVKKTWAGTMDRIKAAWRDLSSAIVEPFVSRTGGGLAVQWGNRLADSMRVIEGIVANLSPEVVTLGVALAGMAALAGPFLFLASKILSMATIMRGASLAAGLLSSQLLKAGVSATTAARATAGFNVTATGMLGGPIAAAAALARNWRVLLGIGAQKLRLFTVLGLAGKGLRIVFLHLARAARTFLASLGPVAWTLIAVGTAVTLLRRHLRSLEAANVSTSEATDILAESLDMELRALQSVEGGADDAGDSTLEFARKNAATIAQLREMDALARHDFLFNQGWEMHRRGEDPEEIHAALQQLSEAADINVTVAFGRTDFSDTERRLSSVTRSAEALEKQFADSWTNMRILQSQAGQQVRSIAGNIADMMSLGDIGAAVDELEAFEEALRVDGRLSSDAAQAVTFFTNEVAKAIDPTGALGLVTSDTSRTVGQLREEIDAAIPSLGVSTEALDAQANAAGGVSEKFGDLADGADVFKSTLEQLTPLQNAAFESLQAGFDPMQRYQENLEAINEASRASAEAAAEAQNKRIDAQIEALDETNDAFDAERDALADQKKSWEDYFTGVEVSFGAYMDSLNQTLEEQRAWHGNLNTIREVAGEWYADHLAAQGPEFAALHAEIASQEHDEIRKAAAVAQQIRDEAAVESLNRILNSIPEFSEAWKSMAVESKVKFALELGTTPDIIDSTIEASKPVMTAAMDELAATAGIGGAKIVGALIGELGLGATDIVKITNQWNRAMAGGLNPIIQTVNGKPIVVTDQTLPTPGGHIYRNTGGLIPGSGPDEDSVPAMLTRGEYVIARNAVNLYGTSALDAINSGRLDPQSLHLNTGGFVTPDDIPAVPTFSTGSEKLNLAGSRVLEGVKAMAAKWVEENAAPQLGSAPGVDAMMAILRQRFPGLALISGLRPGAITATGNPSWHGKGRAVDIPPRMDVFEFIRANYGAQALELIFSPAGGRQLYRGRPHMFSGITRAMHWDHIHWAMNQGGLVGRDGVPVLDQGGILPPGTSTVSNFTGANEVVAAQGMIRAEVEHALKGMHGVGDLRIALAVEGVGADFGQFAAADAVDLIEALTGAWEDAHQQAQEAAERSRLAAEVERARAEFEKADAEDRVRAHDEWAQSIRNLEEADRRRREGIAQSRIQAELARLETLRQIQANREQWEFDHMSTADQLANVTMRLEAEQEYTDEWMDLARQREQLAESLHQEELDRIEERQSAYDDALDHLNNLLDEYDRINQEMRDVQKRHQEETAEARQRYDEQMAQAQQRRNEARADAAQDLADRLLQIEENAAREREQILEQRQEALLSFFSPEQRLEQQWSNSINAVTRNVRDQLEQFESWSQGLDELRMRGLSEEAIQAMDLDSPTAQSLATVQAWANATEAEIAEANAAFAAMNEAAATQAGDEAARMLGSVGEALTEVARSVAEETAQVQADAAERMGEINAEFHEATGEARAELNERLQELDAELMQQMAELTEELNAIGQDQGRTYSEAIAAGIESGIPAILDAVRAVRDATAELHEATGTPITPHVDMSMRELQAYARQINWTEDLSVLMQRIRTQGFDTGGWLPPHSATLALNNTSAWEPVGAGTHMPPVGGKPDNSRLEVLLERIAEAIERSGDKPVVLDTGAIAGAVTDRQRKGEALRMVRAGSAGWSKP